MINILDNVISSENHSYSDNCSNTEPLAALKSQSCGWNSGDSFPGDADDIGFSRTDTPLFFPSDSGSESESDKYIAESSGSLLDAQVILEGSPADIPYPSDEEDEDELIIEDDPLFRSRETIFQDIPESDSEDEDDTPLPPALSEHPALRNAYVHVFVDAAYHGATHESVKSSLTSTLSTIRTMLAGDDSPVDLDLDNMARTLRTVEKRLGVNPDKIITYYFLCPDCWKVYHPSQLKKLGASSCITEDCSGILYTSKRTASRAEKRTPRKVMPSVSLVKVLSHFFMRPGKWDEVRTWMHEDDHGSLPPISREEWLSNLDIHKPLKDIMDGWFWRSIPAGLERIWNPDRKTVDDVDVQRLHQRHVSLACGIVLQINLDW